MLTPDRDDLPPELDIIWLRQLRKPRGRRPPLSREQIVRAAVELADASGLESVSTRNVAARLSVAAASLYWHVPSKGDLHELMFDAIIPEIALPPAGAGWRDALRAIARSTRTLFQRHPWAILLGVQPGLGPNNQRYAQAALAALSDAVTDPGQQVEVLALVNNYLFGFAHREAAWQQARRNSGLDDTQWAARIGRYLDQVAGQAPVTAQVLSTRLHLASDQSFEYGLDCLLHGIAARLAPAPEGPVRPPR
jgi:AcrR family transcriptional regulator